MLQYAPPRTPGCCLRESQLVVATRGKRKGQRGQLVRFDEAKRRWEVNWLDLGSKSFILEKNLRLEPAKSADVPPTPTHDTTLTTPSAPTKDDSAVTTPDLHSSTMAINKEEAVIEE